MLVINCMIYRSLVTKFSKVFTGNQPLQAVFKNMTFREPSRDAPMGREGQAELGM